MLFLIFVNVCNVDGYVLWCGLEEFSHFHAGEPNRAIGHAAGDTGGAVLGLVRRFRSFDATMEDFFMK